MTPTTALTIGTFDGVHRGHQALVAACQDGVASHGGRVVVLAFDPHPATLLRPSHAPARLTTFAQRREGLLRAGADEVVQLMPTPALLDKSPQAFLEEVFATYHPSLIVEGADFRFGKDRAGDLTTLREFAASARCEVRVQPAVEVTLNDHAIVRASSSLVRWLLGHGRAGDAWRVLGQPYELVGTVTRGDRLGRTLGIPTANLATECMLPMNGAYAGRATLPGGETFAAAINVGMRPTVQGLERRIEVHLLRENEGGWSTLPGVAEYGWELRVQVRAFLRDEVKFPGLDALMGQVRRDLARVRAIAHAGALA